MKLVKMSILAAIIALSASATQAFTPPYHINNAPYIGKLTIQSSGSCKAKQVYENAQWGLIYDDTNSQVGWGLISSEGELLLQLEDFTAISDVSDSAPNTKGQQVWYENMGSATTAARIETLANCTINRLISSAKAKGTYNDNPAKNKFDFTLVYPFNGISPTVEVLKGTKTTNKKQLFSGKITFKGTQPAL